MLLGVLLVVAVAFVALGGARIFFAPPRPMWALPAAAGLLAAALAWRWGSAAILLGVAVAAATYFVQGGFRMPITRGDAEREAARALLGVGPGAGPEEIKAAHRAKISAAHPDRGGDRDHAARLNAARDLLLRKR